MGLFDHIKKARRLSVVPLTELKISKADFSPAEFHRDLKNNKHILRYDPSSLFSHGFINPKGSTLNWALAFRTLVMCGVGTFASQYTCVKGQQYSFCFPIIVSSEGLIFASLVSFLLGLFISTTFSRWWAVREKLGNIMNSVSYMTILLKNFSPADEAAQVACRKLTRWMHLGHALIYKQANDDEDLSDLVTATLATPAEVDALNEFKHLSQPPIVYGWAMTLLQPLSLKMAPAATSAQALACLQASLNASQEISALLKTQMPYMYLHLLALTTKIHLALVVFYSGGMIAQGISDHLWTRIFLGYTIIITNNIIYEGLLRVHEMLYNPLGDDNADFPTHLYLTHTIALGSALNVPPPHEEEPPRFSIEVTA